MTTDDRDAAAKSFAIELVALARKHGANHINLSFDMTGHTPEWRERDKWNHGDIRLQWENGRHGAGGNISLSYEATVSIIEDRLGDRS